MPALSTAQRRMRKSILRRTSRALLEYATSRMPFLPLGCSHTIPKALQRSQRLAPIGPILELFDRNTIVGFPTRPIPEECARYVDHVRRANSFVDDRRAALRAKAPCCPGRLVLKAGNCTDA